MAMDLALTAFSRYSLKSLTPAQSLGTPTSSTATPTASLAAFNPARLNASVLNSQTLSNPTAALANQKLQIDTSLSTVRAGQSGANSATVLLAKMKGLVRDAAAASTTGKTLDTAQFNDLAKQLNQAVGTTGAYQGMNLITDSTASLTVKLHSSSGITIDGANLNGSAVLSAVAQASAATSDGVFGAMARAAGATDFHGFSTLNANTPKGRAVFDNLMGQLDSAISTTTGTANRLGQNLSALPAYTATNTTASNPWNSALTGSSAGQLAAQTGQQLGSQYFSALASSQQQAIYAMLR